MSPEPLEPPAFAAYVAPARIRPQLWRLFLGIVLVLAVYLLWLLAIGLGLAAVLGTAAAPLWFGRMVVALDPAPTLLLLSTFVGLALGPMLAVRLLHRRPAASLFGRGARVLRDFALSVAVVAVVYGAAFLPWIWSFDAVPNIDPVIWLLLLPLSILGVLVQTLSEELVFRGYMLQQLAARFRSPIVWMVLPSALFGLLHYNPLGYAGNTWTVIAVITVFGIAAADLTRRTGSIGAAWGIHFANNAFGLLILATSGSLPGLALWRTPYQAGDAQAGALIVSDLVAVLLVWLILSRLLRR